MIKFMERLRIRRAAREAERTEEAMAAKRRIREKRRSARKPKSDQG